MKTSCSSACLLLVMGLAVAACGKRSADEPHWYDETKAWSSQRDRYVEFQQQHGMSEAEAKRAFDFLDTIDKTHGRHKVVVSGDELNRD